MNDPEFTPGPRHLKKTDKGRYPIIGGGFPVFSGTEKIATFDVLSDAWLDAAAPDLYKALEVFTVLIDEPLDNVGGGTLIAPTIKVQAFKDAHAALKKARTGV